MQNAAPNPGRGRQILDDSGADADKRNPPLLVGLRKPALGIGFADTWRQLIKAARRLNAMVIDESTDLGGGHESCVRMRWIDQDVVLFVDDHLRYGKQRSGCRTHPTRSKVAGDEAFGNGVPADGRWLGQNLPCIPDDVGYVDPNEKSIPGQLAGSLAEVRPRLPGSQRHRRDELFNSDFRTSMKLLQIISSLDSAGGGPVEGLIQQGRELVAAGHEVHTASLDGQDFKLDDRMESDAVFLLGPSKWKYAFAMRLEPWLRDNGLSYDVIIIHGMWQYHGYCVAKVARSIGLRYVVFVHGMLDPWFAKRYPLKHLKKWLYWLWGEYRVLKGAKLVLFTTAEEMRLARQSFWLYKVRERLVGYGVRRRDISPSEGRAAFLAAFPRLRDTRNLLFLSRIHPKKGCDMLVESFSKVAETDPRLHLVIAGPDGVGWQVELADRVRRHGLTDRVTFTGMLKGAVKWGAYDAADAFILPSHQENFGIVVAEALTSGVPVLTTYKVNIWREIKGAGAGIIREDTQEGTNCLLADWLALPRAEAAAMRLRAATCFDQNFELRQVTHQLISALSDVCNEVECKYTFIGSIGRSI